MNPYLVLGVSLDADDTRIRQAYLEGIRRASPETDPVRFKEIVTAYEKIKDGPSRCRHELFDRTSPGDSPLDTFLRHARLSVPARPLSLEAMKQFLRACSKT